MIISLHIESDSVALDRTIEEEKIPRADTMVKLYETNVWILSSFYMQFAEKCIHHIEITVVEIKL